MKITAIALTTFFCFVAQTTAFQFTGGRTLWPDIALLLAVYGGLKWGKLGGVQFGALVGLIQDFLSYDSLGIFLFSKGMTGFVVGKLQEKYIHDTPVTRVTVTLSATVFDGFVYGGLTQTFLGYDLWSYLFDSMLAQSLINLAFAFLLLPMIAWIENYVAILSGDRVEKYSVNTKR